MFLKKLLLSFVALSVVIAGAPRCFPMEQLFEVVSESLRDVGVLAEVDCHDMADKASSSKNGFNAGRKCECEVSIAHVPFPPSDPAQIQHKILFLRTVANRLIIADYRWMQIPPDPPPPRIYS